MRSKEITGNQKGWRSKEQNPEKTAKVGTAEPLLWQSGVAWIFLGGKWVSERTTQVRKCGEASEMPTVARSSEPES